MAAKDISPTLPPLNGLHVVDMAWLMVGPETARYLADWGCDVVKLESAARPDPMRSLGPFKDGKPGPNRSLAYHAINAGKRSVTLNPKDPRGHEAALRLARWADVWIEAFTPGVADSLKLSYAHLREVNPRIIVVSTSVLGASGPHARGTSGTGTTGAAYAGATNLLGWPDRRPMGPNGPWTDAVTPRFVVSTILAALHRRRETGEGCLIDVSQAECGLQFLMPAFFDYAVNGAVTQRSGAAGSPYHSPSGLYPCAGDDRWIAIDTVDQRAWTGLRRLLGDGAQDPALDQLLNRLRRRREIDAMVADYTSSRDGLELQTELQAAGVPAHVLADALDFANDDDLKADGYFVDLEDPELGPIVTRGPQASLHRTPSGPTRPAPCLGDSTREILEHICGYTTVEIEALETAGLLR